MKPIVAFFAVIVSITTVMPIFAQERVDSKIRFNDLYGEVSIRPNDEEDDAYEYAELDSVIYENDRIRTKEDSGAILGLEDMTTFVIKPESVLVVRSENPSETKIDMLAGRLMVNVKKMSEGKTMGFEMSQCVAGIKGTMIQLFSNENVNQVNVLRGEVEIYAKNIRKFFKIRAGQSFLIKDTETSINNIENLDKEKKDALADFARTSAGNDAKLLIEKIQKFSDDIKNSVNKLFERIEQFNKNRNKLKIEDAKKEFELLKKDVERYTGAVDEYMVSAEAILNQKFNDESINSKMAELISVIQTYAERFKAVVELIRKIEGEFGKLEKSSSLDIESTEKSAEEAINKINSSIEVLLTDAKSLIESVDDGSNYDDFKNAKSRLQEYLQDLTKISNEMAEISADNTLYAQKFADLKNKYNSTQKYIQKYLKDFESVPSISSDVNKNMSDIENNLPSYTQKVRDYLKEYNAIDRSSVDAKKRYVETVSRLLVGYDRTKRQFVKASRMRDQVVKDFKNSAFKTSEYDEVMESWEKIESAMTELDRDSSELASCVEALKSQLEQILGQ